MTVRGTIALFTACFSAALPAAGNPGAPEVQDSPDCLVSSASPEESFFADGVEAFANGDYAASAATFSSFAKAFPSSERIPDARFLQAKALVMLARFEDAIVVLDTFLELSPNGPHSFEALMLRGEAMIAASPTTPHFGDAAISFAMALETDCIPRNGRIDATMHLADALLRMGDKIGAAQAIGRLSAPGRREAARLAETHGFWRVAKFLPAPET